jgi:hypothetical protein
MVEQVLIMIRTGEKPRIVGSGAWSDKSSFIEDGELFERSAKSSDWLGFYDWLRTTDGKLVGVRLSFDQTFHENLFQRYVSDSVIFSGDVVCLQWIDSAEVDEDLSDDADFGGNSVFFGNAGSLAIGFFAPKGLTA